MSTAAATQQTAPNTPGPQGLTDDALALALAVLTGANKGGVAGQDAVHQAANAWAEAIIRGATSGTSPASQATLQGSATNQAAPPQPATPAATPATPGQAQNAAAQPTAPAQNSMTRGQKAHDVKNTIPAFLSSWVQMSITALSLGSMVGVFFAFSSFAALSSPAVAVGAALVVASIPLYAAYREYKHLSRGKILSAENQNEVIGAGVSHFDSLLNSTAATPATGLKTNLDPEEIQLTAGRFKNAFARARSWAAGIASATMVTGGLGAIAVGAGGLAVPAILSNISFLGAIALGGVGVVGVASLPLLLLVPAYLVSNNRYPSKFAIKMDQKARAAKGETKGSRSPDEHFMQGLCGAAKAKMKDPATTDAEKTKINQIMAAYRNNPATKSYVESIFDAQDVTK